MSSNYLFTLDGLQFAHKGKHAKGPIEYLQPQRWVEINPIGATDADATILQFVGLESQRWTLTARCSTTEKDKLKSVYNARAAVTWKTPQDSTGVSVVMTALDIQYTEPIEDTLFLCRFTLVRR